MFFVSSACRSTFHACGFDVVPQGKGKDSSMWLYTVFSYIDHDLVGLLENERVKLTPSQMKLYMTRLLEGYEYMHHVRLTYSL